MYTEFHHYVKVSLSFSCFCIENTNFTCFMFGAVQFLNVFILILCVSNSFNSAKVTELPPVWERAANSVYHL